MVSTHSDNTSGSATAGRSCTVPYCTLQEEDHREICEQPLLSIQQQELGLSGLPWRDPDDKNAVQLLHALICASDYRIRGEAVRLAGRYLHHYRTVAALTLAAGCPNEYTATRLRALSWLDRIFDPFTPLPGTPTFQSRDITKIKDFLCSLVADSYQTHQVRSKGLEVVSWFASGERLREQILFFYNCSETPCAVSALTAMGRTGEDHWRQYITNHLPTDPERQSKTHLAALEASLQPNHRESRLTFPEEPPPLARVYPSAVIGS